MIIGIGQHGDTHIPVAIGKSIFPLHVLMTSKNSFEGVCVKGEAIPVEIITLLRGGLLGGSGTGLEARAGSGRGSGDGFGGSHFYGVTLSL